jgi:type IV secretory pathway protease TraF
VPIGLYAIRDVTVLRRQLVLARLPNEVHEFAVRADYLRSGIPLVKFVAAAGGDVVCRYQLVVLINGRRTAMALARDASGLTLPDWKGCRPIRQDEVFLLRTHRLSFDSRYFAPIERRFIIGRAFRIW